MQVTKLCYYVCPLGPDLWGENISCMVQMIKAPKNCSFFNIYRFFNWQKQWLRGLLCEWWRQWKQWTESQCYWLRRDGWLEMHGGMPQVRNLGCYIIRLYSVKTDIFQNAFFWYFFIRNDLSRVDLIIKMVLEFLSNL